MKKGLAIPTECGKVEIKKNWSYQFKDGAIKLVRPVPGGSKGIVRRIPAKTVAAGGRAFSRTGFLKRKIQQA